MFGANRLIPSESISWDLGPFPLGGPVVDWAGVGPPGPKCVWKRSVPLHL